MFRSINNEKDYATMYKSGQYQISFVINAGFFKKNYFLQQYIVKQFKPSGYVVPLLPMYR